MSSIKPGLIICGILLLLIAAVMYGNSFVPNIDFSLSDPILGNWSWYDINLTFNSTVCIYQHGNYTEVGTWQKLPNNEYSVNCTDTSTVYTYYPENKTINTVFKKVGV